MYIFFILFKIKKLFLNFEVFMLSADDWVKILYTGGMTFDFLLKAAMPIYFDINIHDYMVHDYTFNY